MKRIIFSLCLFIFIRTEAQQINPVPDYVFSNKMSVGRNAVTDTAAYFSIGPRYGAVRGFMPPMVTDTAVITTGKRNGLTIFSVQRNKYMYWDSVRVRWSDFAGSSGAYIFASDTSSMLTPYLRKSDTSSMLSPYIRAAGNGLTKSGQSLLVDTAAIATRARVQKAVDSLGAVKGSGTVTSVSAGTGMSFTTITSTGSVAADTTVLSTRAWRRKGLDSLAALELSISDTASMLTPYTRGSGTTNYLPKFTGSRTLGNSLIFDNGTNVGIGTTSPANELHVVGNIRLGASNAYQIGNDNKSFSVTNRVTNQRALVIDTANSIFFGTLANADGGASMLNVNMQNRTVNVGNILNVTDTGTFGSGIAVRASALQHEIMTLWTIAGFDGNSNQFLINSNAYYDAVDNRNESMKSGYSHQIDFNIGSGDMVFRNTSTSAGAGNTAVTFVENMKINAAGEVLINTSDQGAYPLQVGGTLYTSTGAILAASSGNVGIGTTSPGNKLHVNGTNARVRTTGGNHGFEFDNGRTGFVSGGADIIHFYTSGNVRGVFQADGEFLVNTTTDAGAFALQVAGSIYSSSGQILAAKGSGPSFAFSAETDLGFASLVGDIISFMNGGVQIMQFRDTGLRIMQGQIWTDGLGSASRPVYAISGSQNTGIFMPTTASLGYTVTGNERMRLQSDGELLINTTTDAGTYALQVSGAIYNTTTITTGAPTSGSAKPWRLGEAATVSPTSPNRTIRVEIDGTVYYIHAKTTND